MKAKKTKIVISPTLRQGIFQVWQQIGADMEGVEISNEEAVEVCYDADRLQSFGYPEAEAEFKALIKKHGIDPVRKALAKEVSLV